MNNILVLIDFTPVSEAILDQAIKLGRFKGSSVTLSYVMHGSDKREDIEAKFEPYLAKFGAQGLICTVFIGEGNFKKAIAHYVTDNHPDLVLVATHGKKGLKQNLFGSNIYDLVKIVPSAVLVLGEHTAPVEGGFKKALLPAAPHANYLLKVAQTCEILSETGEIVILNITKTGVEQDPITVENISKTKAFLDEKGIKWNYVEQDSHSFSVGYSKETLEYLSHENIDLVAIMAESSHAVGSLTPDMDKENILHNEKGVAVLCANHE